MLKLLSKSNDNDIFHLLDAQGFLTDFSTQVTLRLDLFQTLRLRDNMHPPILFQTPFQ